MILNKNQQSKINNIGQKHNLQFIIMYGSYGRKEEKQGSDLDIAIYGKNKINNIIDIIGDLSKIFGDNKERELDVKSLHNVNPFFRYEVIRDGQLIYGNQSDFDEYCVYAYKGYHESKSLIRLQDNLIKKRQNYLNKLTS